jgi:hypothetical protein
MAADPLRELRTFHGLTFPETHEGAAFAGSYNNEARVPGLGYTAVYKRHGWNIQVSIYDLGLSIIPNDKSSELLREEFEQAKLDIQHAGYDEVEPGRWFELFRADGQMMLCTTCIITSVAHGFSGDDSFLAVTAWRNKFIKFRVTAEHTETSESDVQRFVATLAQVLFPQYS